MGRALVAALIELTQKFLSISLGQRPRQLEIMPADASGKLSLRLENRSQQKCQPRDERQHQCAFQINHGISKLSATATKVA